MNMLLALTLTVFGVYRIARMIADEDGPADIFRKLRDRHTEPTSWIARGIRCQLCIGFWTAGVLTLYLVAVSLIPLSFWPLCWLGVAGAAVKVKEFWSR